MKRVLVFICCYFGFTIKLFSQTTYDTSFYTSYYGQKLTLFKLSPQTKNAIIFLGDSITDIGEWSEIFKNIHVKNRGVSSDNTFGVLARLDEIVSIKPAKVFIMIGINDISKSTPDSVIISNYKKIITTIKTLSPKTKIIVQSILPTSNNFSEFIRHQNKMEHILFINKTLQSYCAKHHIVYVDLYGSFLDDEKKLNKKYTNDGLHINGYGYMKWKEVLIRKGLMR